MKWERAVRACRGNRPARWGALEATRACLDALRNVEHPDIRVFLVDNALALDDTTVRRAAPLAVELLRPHRNLGFADRCNLGIAATLVEERRNLTSMSK
jgi:GT2 family glycosyltransferase